MEKPTIILATSNGVGMGHLARASAIALALKEYANPIIVSMAGGIAEVPEFMGIRCEYIPGRDRLWMSREKWDAYLRDRLLAGLEQIEQVYINGDMSQRVPHNLNISFNYVEGESMIMALKQLAVSSGSACTSASLEPSYVLRALGRNDELAHSSIRFTLGRYTTEQEIDFAIDLIQRKIARLRELSPLWDMYKDGIDLDTIEWASH
jgi:cysteine desulfurase